MTNSRGGGWAEADILPPGKLKVCLHEPSRIHKVREDKAGDCWVGDPPFASLFEYFPI